MSGLDAMKAAVALAAGTLGAATADAPRRAPVYVSPLSIPSRLTIDDTLVLPGERVARIHARLSQPARRPLAWHCITTNGSAYADGQYRKTEADVMFAPGQTDMVVAVPILRDLGDASFTFNCAWPKTYPSVRGGSGIVRQVASRPPIRVAAAAPPGPVYPPVARTTGRTLVFNSTLHEPISPAAVKGAWRTRPAWGRVQAGNGEIAPYTDAATDRSVNPHPIVDGRRVLRAEHVATRDAGKSYAFSAAMLTSQNLFSYRYGYIEMRARIDRAQGTVAAFWLLPATGKWPPEIDIFEAGLGDRPNVASTLHFANDGYGTAEGIALPFTPDDGKFHTYGFDWTPAWQVTFIDGVEAVRRPNIFNEPMFIMLDVSVGGLGPPPGNPKPGWKSEMTIEYVKVWR